MRLVLPALLAAGCAPAETDTAAPIDIPEHSECLAEGEVMSDDVCLAVVEDAGFYPTVSENKAGVDATEDDPRLSDPDFLFLTSEVQRCACVCCHSTRYGGAGVYFYDLDFWPVWIDSASLWSLSVFGGWNVEPGRTLPTSDLERVRAYLEKEADRRQALE